MTTPFLAALLLLGAAALIASGPLAGRHITRRRTRSGAAARAEWVDQRVSTDTGEIDMAPLLGEWRVLDPGQQFRADPLAGPLPAELEPPVLAHHVAESLLARGVLTGAGSWTDTQWRPWYGRELAAVGAEEVHA